MTIQLISLLNLVLGFAVTITTPRIAIERLGVDNYALYALIVGFSSVLAFADFGLQPGMTRSLSGPLAAGRANLIRATVWKAIRVCTVAWASLTAISATIVAYVANDSSANLTRTFSIFALSCAAVIGADIFASVIRASGQINYSYLAKSLYLIIQLTLINAAHELYDTWRGVEVVLYVQLTASLAYFWVLLRRFLSITKPRPAPRQEAASHTTSSAEIWREAWRSSAAERLTKFLQLIVALVERPTLLALSGPVFVTSYDLLIRLSTIASATPAALSQPLQAMIAYDSVRAPHERKFDSLEHNISKAVMALALLGLCIASGVWAVFHEAIFREPSVLPFWTALLVIGGTSVNVATAPIVARSMATTQGASVSIKTQAELIGLASALLVGYITESGLNYLAVRHLTISASAVVYIVIVRNQHE